MTVSIMAAMSSNHVIGYQNRLPWGSLPADWAYLYEVTAGKKMIMGRKSYDAADRVWSKAGNIVLTRQADYPLENGFESANTLEIAIEILRGQGLDEIFIIGGAEIFRQAIPNLVDKIYLTLVHQNFEGDAFFPRIDPSVFSLTNRKDFKADDENKYDYSFLIYEKR